MYFDVCKYTQQAGNKFLLIFIMVFPHRMGCADPTRRGACCLPRAPHATCCAWCMRGAVHAAHLCCVLRTTCRAPCVACPMPCAVRYTLGTVCRTPRTVCPARQVVGGAYCRALHAAWHALAAHVAACDALRDRFTISPFLGSDHHTTKLDQATSRGMGDVLSYNHMPPR